MLRSTPRFFARGEFSDILSDYCCSQHDFLPCQFQFDQNVTFGRKQKGNLFLINDFQCEKVDEKNIWKRPEVFLLSRHDITQGWRGYFSKYFNYSEVSWDSDIFTEHKMYLLWNRLRLIWERLISELTTSSLSYCLVSLGGGRLWPIASARKMARNLNSASQHTVWALCFLTLCFFLLVKNLVKPAWTWDYLARK